jgi:acyl dehydratase
MTGLVAVEVGSAADELVVGPIDRTDIVRYEGASGFYNPIHHDELFAHAAGYPAPVSVGMFQAGLWGRWMASWLGPEHVRRVRFRFREQVWPGDELILTGTVVRRYEQDGEWRADVEGTCVRRNGGVAVEGEATFVVAPPQHTDN